jgi:hypothetical protein
LEAATYATEDMETYEQDLEYDGPCWCHTCAAHSDARNLSILGETFKKEVVDLRLVRNTTSNSRQFGWIPVLLILVIGATGTGATAAPTSVRSLFDLSIEALMQIRIGDELNWSDWTQGEDDASNELRTEWRDGTGSHVAARRSPSGGVHAGGREMTWNR